MTSKKRSPRGSQGNLLDEVLGAPLPVPSAANPAPLERVFALQRRLEGRDGARWRTVAYVASKHRAASMAPAVKLAQLSVLPMELRLVEECEDGSYKLAHSWNARDGWH